MLEPLERLLTLDMPERAAAILLADDLRRFRASLTSLAVCGKGIGRTLPCFASVAPNFSCLIALT